MPSLIKIIILSNEKHLQAIFDALEKEYENSINEEVDVILKVWAEINPLNAFELFGMINKIISNMDKMDKLLIIATEQLIKKFSNFYDEVNSNSASHCYAKVLEDHKLLSLISKQ